MAIFISKIMMNIQEVEDIACKGRATGKIKVVERARRTMSSILSWRSEKCGREECKVCQNQPVNVGTRMPHTAYFASLVKKKDIL